MPENYGRDLDLNLLRVFVVVAETGSVTRAAARLYLTQPAVSAALRRLTDAVGAPLFVRHGRGIALSARGERLLAVAKPHLQVLVEATLAAPPFDPATSDRTIRLGLSDATETWLLPGLLRALRRDAPAMRVIALPVQFRTVEDALVARRVELAVTVADALPQSIARQPLFTGGFVCLYDPRHVKLGRALSARAYFAAEHVIVSYNGDLRGVIEDLGRKARSVRCSLGSFSHIGDVVDGTALLATVPAIVAAHIRVTRPHLRTAALPFRMHGTPVELLWPTALTDDPACAFVRARIAELARDATKRAVSAS